MSALIFYTDSEQIIVATDTLVVDQEGKPSFFTSKAIYLPHLRTIIAGTGIGGFSVKWAEHVNNEMLLSGIENLDYHTPQGLRDLWSEVKKELGFPEKQTTTVYQFDLSPKSLEPLGFAYRSTNDFKSENLGYGIGCKPECMIPEGPFSVDYLAVMMREQRENQEKLPLTERLHIGGECVVLHLTKENCNAIALCQFDGFDEQFARAEAAIG